MSPPASSGTAASAPASGAVVAADTAPLGIERFLRHEGEARALSAALGRSVIDRSAQGAATQAALAAQTGLATELGDPERFTAEARTFELFRYDRGFVETRENRAATRRRVACTACPTRDEAGPILDRLDLGGNSGEFAARACARTPWLSATVVDLPVVCALGRDKLANRAEAAQVAFRPADMRSDPLPGGHDLVFAPFVREAAFHRDALRQAGLVAGTAGTIELSRFRRSGHRFGGKNLRRNKNLSERSVGLPTQVCLSRFRRSGHRFGGNNLRRNKNLGGRSVGLPTQVCLDMPFRLTEGVKTGEPA